MCYSNIIMDKDSRRKARFVERLTWWQATGIDFGVFIAPIVISIILSNISDATLLDGLFGIYRDLPLPYSIVSPPILAVLLGTLCALIFAIHFAARRKDLTTLKRVMPLALPACIFLIVLLYY